MNALLSTISHWHPNTIAQVQKTAEKQEGRMVFAVIRKRDLEFVNMDHEPPFGAEAAIRSHKGCKTAQIIRIK